MSILWAGGEDIDFLPNGAVSITTNTALYRSTYARCGLAGSSSNRKSNAFAGGTVTSCWVGAQVGLNSANSTGRMLGLVSSSVGAYKGLWIGLNSSNQVTLLKYDDSTYTTLGTSTAAHYVNNSNVVCKIDMQLISYGASATISVYVNGALVISYSGDPTVSGVTALDAVGIGTTSGFNFLGVSEIIVADTDTRALSLMTMAPTAAGTTDTWSGAYTDVNETTNSDATVLSTNTAAQDEQFNITDLAAGSFAIVAVAVKARAALAGGSVPTGLKVGVNSGGAVGVGSTFTPVPTFTLIEQIFATNPATSSAWVQSEMNALQINLRSV